MDTYSKAQASPSYRQWLLTLLNRLNYAIGTAHLAYPFGIDSQELQNLARQFGVEWNAKDTDAMIARRVKKYVLRSLKGNGLQRARRIVEERGYDAGIKR